MNNEQKSWTRALTAIDKIEHSDGLDDVFNACQAYVHEVGGTSLLIGRLVNPIIAGRKISAFGMADWPEEWAKKWIDEDLVIHDPVSQYALKSRATFEWETAKQHGTKFGRSILEEGRGYNLNHGVAIPVTAGHLPLGLVSVGYEKPLTPVLLSRLEIVAIHAYTRMLDFLDDETTMPLVKLTKREIDILNFTAVGKTSWEISIIYGIAESTVKKHLQNIITKTNAANKTHAVTKAFSEGLLAP